MSLNEEDKNVVKNLGKLLGKTDIEGQLSQIDLTLSFLDGQIEKAEKEKEKNEKLYKTLGVMTGLRDSNNFTLGKGIDCTWI